MYSKGLKGVVAVETKLSQINGNKGELSYRGIPINELAIQYSFEEIAWFLWNGSLPDKVELETIKLKMKSYRNLPKYMEEIIQNIPLDADIMSVLRTVVSSINIKNTDVSLESALQVTAIMPTIIAFRYRLYQNKPFIQPHPKYDHVKNYLYMLTGTEPADDHVHALETYMILTMEHGMNASTFAARVTVSTESDMISGVTSALGAMKGPLHGGAPSGVIELLNEINKRTNAVNVIKNKLGNGELLMGFGHRVYKTFDPRAMAIKEKLTNEHVTDPWLQLALYVEEVAIKLLDEYKPGRLLRTNVEFYAAAIMRAINMESELFTPTFSAARSVGWTAHILEQLEDNTIFRPESVYVGS